MSAGRKPESFGVLMLANSPASLYADTDHWASISFTSFKKKRKKRETSLFLRRALDEVIFSLF